MELRAAVLKVWTVYRGSKIGEVKIYRSSVNEVAPPIMVGGPFTSPLVVIKKFQTEMRSGPPPHHDGGGQLHLLTSGNVQMIEINKFEKDIPYVFIIKIKIRPTTRTDGDCTSTRANLRKIQIAYASSAPY